MISLTLAIVRVILGLYPRRFRDRFGSDVLESVRHDLKRAHGVAQFVVVSTRAVIDALAGLVPEHRSERRRQHRVAAAVTDDLRDAIRSLRQSPTFTVVALGVLSLAIGAGTAIYSVVDAVALRGLPFDEHDRIVAVLEHNKRTGQTYNAMQQNFLDWRDAERSFEHLAASRRAAFRLRNARNEPADARALRVTADFFDVLRVGPALGRAFGPQDEIEGRDRQVILSDSFWQNAFGGAPDMVGRTITLNNQPWMVVGVMPRTFSYPVGSAQPVEIFAPLAFGAADRARVGGHNYQYSVIGRLERGVSIAQAADDMDRINVRLSAQHPGWNTLNPEGHIQVVTLHQRMVGPVARRWMWLLLGSVALVVLIACANVANLMLARATVRARELSLRAALGASAWRLTRALLVEGVVLSLSAAAIGLVLALGGVEVLRAWLPEGVPRVAAIAVNLRVLVVTVLAASLTGIFFGVVPAIHSARPDLAATLREGSRSLTPAAGRRRMRQLLVVVEVALAVVLVVGAGLFVTSFIRLMRIDPGFDYKDVLAINVAVDYPPDKIEAGFERGRAYVFAMLDAVRAVPGVQSAEAVSGGPPLSGGWSTNHLTLPGRGELTKSEDEIGTRWVTAGYLELLRVPLIRGRYLQAGDREGAPPVVVINQAAAAHYWPGTDPIGQRVTIESFPVAREMTVVGVVGDIRHRGLEEPVQQEAYIPIAQDSVLSAALVMRTAGTPIDVLPAVKRAIWSVNPDQRIFEGTVTLEGHLDRLIAQRRFNMALLALFGVLGLVIAAVGIYGVMAFAVAQRVSEIGIRMALGASPRMVMILVLRNAATLIVIGLLIGAVGAWNLSASAEAFLFQVAAKDFWIFLSAVATLAVAGLVASVVPARRAARVDPIIALRS